MSNALRLTLFTIFVTLCFICVNCNKNGRPARFEAENTGEISENAVNINTASAAELEKLPKIGEELARRIIEYRETNGKFQRKEYLILVRGMSDKKFREIEHLIKTE